MDEPTLALIVGKRKTFFHSEEFIINTLIQAIAPIFQNIHQFISAVM
jgi:hypothetical protein